MINKEVETNLIKTKKEINELDSIATISNEMEDETLSELIVLEKRQIENLIEDYHQDLKHLNQQLYEENNNDKRPTY